VPQKIGKNIKHSAPCGLDMIPKRVAIFTEQLGQKILGKSQQKQTKSPLSCTVSALHAKVILEKTKAKHYWSLCKSAPAPAL
jgi:hypothetical protein